MENETKTEMKAWWADFKKSDDYISFMRLFKKRETRLFLCAVGFRLVMYLLAIVIMMLFGTFEDGMTFQEFLESWKRWDANGYMSISEYGYSAWIENDMYLCLVFFPLYPWLVRFAALFLGQYTLAGLCVSTVAFGISWIYLDKLMCLEDSEEASGNAILGMSVFPFAFFFGAIMTESVFAAVTTAFFYYLRKHKWLSVMFLGFLACLCKVQGVLLTLAILVELLYTNKAFALIKLKKWKKLWHSVILNGLKCVPMLGGTLIYLLINYNVAGDPLIFLTYQRVNWGNQMISIWKTVAYLIKDVKETWYTSLGMCIWLPEFILIFIFVGAIIYGFKKKMRPTYMSFLIIWFVITYSSSHLISAGRYTLSALPLFMLEGKLVTEHPKLKMPILGLSFALMMIYYVGFLTQRPIM